jgi:hypothetical protein
MTLTLFAALAGTALIVLTPLCLPPPESVRRILRRSRDM